MRKFFVLVLVLGMFGGVYFTYAYNFFRPFSKVIVGPKWVHQAQFAGMYSAQERNMYAYQGLDVSFKEFDFETNQVDDLLNGSTDFAITSGEEALLAIDQGAPIIAVATIYQTSPYTIVSLKDAQITTPSHFKNKILGVKGGKIEEKLFYDLLLGIVGLEESDAYIKELGLGDTEYVDLLEGRADTVGIYRTDQLYYFEQNNIDFNLVNPEQYGVNMFNDVIITRLDLVQEDPKLVQHFLKATINGWEFAVENPDKAIDDTLKYVTKQSYQDREYQAFILKNSLPLIKTGSSAKIGRMSHGSWVQLADQLKHRGLLSEDFDVQQAYTLAMLP